MISSLQLNDEVYEKKMLIDSIIEDRIFDNIALNPYEELQKVAPLMRYYDKETITEIKFLLKNEKLKAVILEKEDTTELRDSIASDINALSKTISSVAKKEKRIAEVLNSKFWTEITIDIIDKFKIEFAPLMKYRNPGIPDILISDIKDDVIERRWIQY